MRPHQPRPANTPLSNAGWSTFQTGTLYAQMGFTTVVEPAMAPYTALHTHLELADIPIIDKATLAILGNDDFTLSLLRNGKSSAMLDDYVAWVVGSTRALGVKVINAGAAAAFKENVRSFSSGRCRARIWRQFAQDRQVAAGFGDAGSEYRTRSMCTPTISALPAAPIRPLTP